MESEEEAVEISHQDLLLTVWVQTNFSQLHNVPRVLSNQHGIGVLILSSPHKMARLLGHFVYII